MPGDRFQNTGATDSADDAEAVTPSDSVNLGNITRALYVGTTGNIVVVMKSGRTATLNSVPAGALLPLRVSRVNSTNTTASNIVALY